VRSQHDLLITRLFGCRDFAVPLNVVVDAATGKGAIMAKRKKQSKVQK
jgi:hypothetical protein